MTQSGKRKYPSQNVGIVESMINLNQLMHIISEKLT